MYTSATRRLIKDLQKFQKDQSQFIVNPLKDDLMLWTATFEGAQDTIWEGGLFTLRLVFSDRYPNTPPKLKFLNKMFHPNIYNDGRICLDMLYNQWSPIYDVWGILTAIKTLLTDPNTQSPANIQASNIFRDNKALYEYRVKQVVQKSLQFVLQDEQIIKDTEAQIKQREAEEARAEKLQKQRQQRQAKVRNQILRTRFSNKPIGKSAGFAIRSPGIYKITDIISNKSPSQLNQSQSNGQSYSGSQDDDQSDYLHSQEGFIKEVFTEPAAMIELKPIKLENIQNTAVHNAIQNIKKEQKASTEAVLPVINAIVETVTVKIQEAQPRQNNQESFAKQDQLIVKEQQKQQNKGQQDITNQNEEKQDDTKNKGPDSQFSENNSCLDQHYFQEQEQLESQDNQDQEEYQQQSQDKQPAQALESSDK